MAVIRIGKEYEKAFRSIAALYENNCIADGIIESIKGDSIKESKTNNEFVFDPTIDSISSSVEKKMTNEGASWFRGFRGDTVDTGMARWNDFISSVSKSYHKQYSYLEFEEEINDNNKNNTNYDTLINNFTNVFLPAGNYISKALPTESDFLDYYCIAFKFTVDDGGGQAQTLLAKMFFSKVGNKFKPVNNSFCEVIEKHIKTSIEEGNIKEIEDDITIDNNIINHNVLAALDATIAKDNCADFIYVGNEEDSSKLAFMVTNGQHSLVRLRGNKIEVFSITHVKWHNKSFYLYKDSTRLLKISFGVSDSVDVTCENCSSENKELITSNMIYLDDGSTLSININQTDLGLSDNDLKNIKENSEFKNHLFTLSCHNSFFRCNGICNHLNCTTNCFITTEGEKKCINCPYFEVVLPKVSDAIIKIDDDEEKLHLTKDMVFARRSVLPGDYALFNREKVETQKCSICQREFLSKALTSGYCSTCEKAMSMENNSNENEYRKFSQMLPFSLRMVKLFTKKICTSDEEIIVFILGDSNKVKPIVVNKVNLSNDGLLSVK